MVKHILLGLTILSCNVNVSFARTSDVDTLRHRTIDEVLVLGNLRQDTLFYNVVQPQASLATSVSKISHSDISRQGASTLIDALKYTPGAWIESRGRKLEQVFSVRGQRYPYPSFAVNGIWQKDFQHISYYMNAANIEEITVVRSSAALLNNLTALSGVINIKTRQPAFREGRLFMKYGSMNSYQANVSYADVKEKFNYNIGINGFGTTGVKNLNDKEHMWNANASFDWRISDKWSWAFNTLFMYGARELYMARKPASDAFLNKKEKYDPYKAVLLNSRLKYKANDKFYSELQLNFSREQPLFHSTNLKTNKSVEYHEISNEFTVNLIHALALSKDNTLRFGTLYNYWLSPNGKCFYYGKKEKVHTFSAVVTDQHSFGRLMIDGGMRWSRQYYADWGGFSIEGAPNIFNNVASIKNEWQSPEWQATLGLTYALANHSSLNFSYAGGVISPRRGGLTEEGKKPHNETRMNFDLGYSLKLPSAGHFSLTAFMVNRANGIAYSSATIENEDGVLMELYKNLDSRNYGIEAVYSSPLFFHSLSFFANVTVMIGQRKEKEDWKKDDELPCFIANLGANFKHSNWDVNAYLNYVGPYRNDRFMGKDYVQKFGKAFLGDFLTMDLTVGYSLGKSKKNRLFVEAHNLFDNNFKTAAGYEDRGRILSAGFDLKF